MAGLPDSRVVRLADADLGVRIAGDGAPVLFLHGMGGASASWREQFASLAGGFRVAAWDAPGYGASADALRCEASAEGYAGLVDGLAQELGFARFHLVGHSLGALVAAAYAASRPDRLHSLTLSSLPRGYRNRPDAAEGLHRRVAEIEATGAAAVAAARARHVCAPGADPAVVAQVRDVMDGLRPAGYRLSARVVAGADPAGHLRSIAIPTLVMVGEEDAVTPPDTVAALAGLLSNGRYRAVAGAGHAAYVERPAAFNAMLLDHIGGGHG